jgi:TetR/AcrR family transcriptional regulator, cholesterol catabolism regulator
VVSSKRPAAEPKAARTRRRILAAAAAELTQHGYAASSLRRIADGADLQLGSLYFHFTTKDELLTEVTRDAVDTTLSRMAMALAALPAAATAADRLTTAISVHLAALHESHDRGAAVLGLVGPHSAAASSGVREHARRYLRSWLPLVEDAQRAGVISADLHPISVRDLLVGALNSTMGSQPSSPADVTAMIHTAVGLFVRVAQTKAVAGATGRGAPRGRHQPG